MNVRKKIERTKFPWGHLKCLTHNLIALKSITNSLSDAFLSSKIRVK